MIAALIISCTLNVIQAGAFILVVWVVREDSKANHLQS